MVVYCCAFGCNEKFVKGGSVTFHCFPKDEARRKLWTIRLRRKDFTPSCYSKICSKHFTDDCFEKRKFGGTWLKSTAVPTLFAFLDNDDIKTPKDQKPPEKDPFPFFDESLPCTSEIFEKRKRLCYLGDFNDEDVVSPSQAKKVLQIAQEQTYKFRKRVKSLEHQNKSLKKQIASINELLDKLKNKSMISDAAHSALKRASAPRWAGANLVQLPANHQ